MNIGDKVRCIDASDVELITVGNEYIVKDIRCSGGLKFIDVYNDNKVVGTYLASRFEVVSKEVKPSCAKVVVCVDNEDVECELHVGGKYTIKSTSLLGELEICNDLGFCKYYAKSRFERHASVDSDSAFVNSGELKVDGEVIVSTESKLHAGDRVRCIDNKMGKFNILQQALTEGNMYTIISTSGEYVKVLNDEGYEAEYNACRFEVVNDSTVTEASVLSSNAEATEEHFNISRISISANPDTINVLGTDYTIHYVAEEDDEYLATVYGYCDFLEKAIVLKRLSLDDFMGNQHTLDAQYKVNLRHELIHAFLYESGLDSSSIDAWARNEEMIDWIAIQLPKIVSVMSALKVF